MDLSTFNLLLNEAFLGRHQRQPWPEYPWNNAQQVRLNSLKTGTLILTCPTETKYRTLPFRLTQQLQVNLDPALIEIIWDELSKNHSQFFIQPTWVLTFETGPLSRFTYQAVHQDVLSEFKLDSDNVPNNSLGLLDCMEDQRTMIFLFRSPDRIQANLTIQRILEGLEALFIEYSRLLLTEFLEPLRRTGTISRSRFDQFFQNYSEEGGFKIFVSEIAGKLPEIQPLLDPTQYQMVPPLEESHEMVLQPKISDWSLEQVNEVIYPADFNKLNQD